MSDAKTYLWCTNGKIDLEKAKAWGEQNARDRAAAADQLVVYAEGMLACSVCAAADLNADQVAELVNRLNPAGTTNGWGIADEPFATGSPNPCPCDDNPGRRHWLLYC